MKVIYNKIIPLKGYKAMACWPFIFSRADVLTPKDVRHEEIHGAQQKELLLVGFLIVYVLIWLWRLIRYGGRKAYREHPMELEAYDNEMNPDYLSHRRFLAWARKK